jgi:hypothetical protein
VILDLRIDTSESADARARSNELTTVRAAIGTPLFQHAKRPAPRTEEVPVAAPAMPETEIRALKLAHERVSRHHPARISPG